MVKMLLKNVWLYRFLLHDWVGRNSCRISISICFEALTSILLCLKPNTATSMERAKCLFYFGCKSRHDLSLATTKPTKWHVCPPKTQNSLGIRPVWSESLLCAQWVAKDPNFLHADSENSDQIGRMPRLIWVFAGRTHFVGFVMWLI